ncbi:hypothetical protein EGW08_001634 [Elysia chlorotica]|uniref:Uncharacterized protein n=1 Tax=Elysia chlorotica TaxID=188477 RepID=A0A3S1BKV3_ELYCH|nr:hypothetical protein EGW08_001634 [Elysia chlorotica]
MANIDMDSSEIAQQTLTVTQCGLSEQGNVNSAKSLPHASNLADQANKRIGGTFSKSAFNVSGTLGDEDDLFEFDEDHIQEKSPFFCSKVQVSEKDEKFPAQTKAPAVNKFLKFVKISTVSTPLACTSLGGKDQHETHKAAPRASPKNFDIEEASKETSDSNTMNANRHKKHLPEEQLVSQNFKSKTIFSPHQKSSSSAAVSDVENSSVLSQFSQRETFSSHPSSQKQSFKNFKFTKLKGMAKSSVTGSETSACGAATDLPGKSTAAPEDLLHSQSSHGDDSQPPGSVPYMGIGPSPSNSVSQSLKSQNESCKFRFSTLGMNSQTSSTSKCNSVQSGLTDMGRASSESKSNKDLAHVVKDSQCTSKLYQHKRPVSNLAKHNSNTSSSQLRKLNKPPTWLSRMKDQSRPLSSTPLSSSSSFAMTKLVSHSQAKDLSDEELDELLDIDL